MQHNIRAHTHTLTLGHCSQPPHWGVHFRVYLCVLSIMHKTHTHTDIFRLINLIYNPARKMLIRLNGITQHTHAHSYQHFHFCFAIYLHKAKHFWKKKKQHTNSHTITVRRKESLGVRANACDMSSLTHRRAARSAGTADAPGRCCATGPDGR